MPLSVEMNHPNRLFWKPLTSCHHFYTQRSSSKMSLFVKERELRVRLLLFPSSTNSAALMEN